MTVRAHLRHEIYTNDFSLYVCMSGEGGKTRYLRAIEFEDGEPHELREPLTSHALRAPVRELVQAIMDAAWEAGVRPTGIEDVKNETAAIRAHLSDMRQLAFAKLNVEKPTE